MMLAVQRNNGRGLARILAFGFSVACLSGGTVQADEHYLVMRNGRKIPIVRSETELGIIFHTAPSASKAVKRLQKSTSGTLRDFPGVTNGRVKLLQLGSVTAKRRADLRKDPAVQDVGRVYRFATSSMPVISVGRLVVKLRPGLSEDQRDKIWTDYGVDNVSTFEGLHDVYMGTLTRQTDDEVETCEKLVADAQVLWAHPDFLRAMERRQVAPSDTFFGEQWHLNNTGQTENGLVDADIDAPEAWAEGAEGEGVVFSMFDDSCDVTHEDLASNYIGVAQDTRGFGGCTDFCETSDNDLCEDGGQGAVSATCRFGWDCLDCGTRDFNDPRPRRFNDSHGTAVMGLAVASGNSVGVRGVSFRSRFTVSRGLNDFPLDSEIASAYTFAMQQNVDVHINSWGPVFGFGVFPNAPIIEDAIETAFLEGRDLDGPGGDDPLGMVIVFASGNGDFNGNGVENFEGFDLSMLPTVIGVGASSDRDERAKFSNFGRQLEFVAPGHAIIATTDNEDTTNISFGFNLAGQTISSETGRVVDDIDPIGSYTGHFNGTSAACPIAAGVAGLILSVNPNLTATDVRTIMEHTCDQVSPNDADYNGISRRSLTYGYGRINAHAAVLAAKDSLTNSVVSWPDSPSDALVIGSSLLWRPGARTAEFLLVESNTDFAFVPDDGACYDATQANCDSSTIVALPDGVTVGFIGCTSGDCSTTREQIFDFTPPDFGRQFFAIFARNDLGNYAFGLPIDSTSSSEGGTPDPETIAPPAVTITASPLEGQSPLTVRFNGNAVGSLEIDGSRTTWDFDVDDDVRVDATTANASFTYVVAPGETRRFTALLTMVDVAGNEGAALVRIRVQGSGSAQADDGVATTDVRISITGEVHLADERCLTDVCGGAPLNVTVGLVAGGTEIAFPVQAVLWDLGDGTTASSQSVVHTYTNVGSTPLVLPISANVTLSTSGGGTRTTTATTLITILPGTSGGNFPGTVLDGTQTSGAGGPAGACGALGMFPLFFGLIFLVGLRRLRN